MKSFDAVRSALKVLAGPARQAGRKPGIVIRAYRGAGSRSDVILFGRVFKQPSFALPFDVASPLGELVDIWRRMWSRGVRNASIEVRLGQVKKRARTDRYGFFVIRMNPGRLPDAERLWYRAAFRLMQHGGAGVHAEADVFIAPATAGYVVISDIDDTVVYTGVANKIKMLWRLFFEKAQSRVAFPGVAEFYRALYQGAPGRRHNPILYISRGPWSIYEVLEKFFSLHDIPVGPILFLRYWGMTFDHPLPRRAKDHKLSFIRQMLNLYHDLPFILIGDSGQKDPETYARIVHEHQGRILAVYIREVGQASDRRRAIGKLAEKIEETGCPLILSADSYAMAKHAAQQGFISAEGVSDVTAACRNQQD